MVDQAEQLLLDMGFHQVRIRIHGTMARMEVVPDEMDKLIQKENHLKIAKHLHSLGFSYVLLEPDGYRTGSINLTIKQK